MMTDWVLIRSEIRRKRAQMELRFWKWAASRLSAHMPQGIHIHGNFQIDADESLALTGLNVNSGGGTAFEVRQKRHWEQARSSNEKGMAR